MIDDLLKWAPVAVAVIAAFFSAISARSSARSASLADRGQKVNAAYQILKDGRELHLKFNDPTKMTKEEKLACSLQFYSNVHFLYTQDVIDKSLWILTSKELKEVIKKDIFVDVWKKRNNLYTPCFVNIINNMLDEKEREDDSHKSEPCC